MYSSPQRLFRQLSTELDDETILTLRHPERPAVFNGIAMLQKKASQNHPVQ